MVATVSEKTDILSRISGTFSNLIFRDRDRELPFAFILITLMASCGISPYESFKRLMSVHILPFIQKESREIVRQVEVLGKDPLKAMLRRAEETESKIFSDFLKGYVSTVKSGGNVTSYLESKLRSVIEIQTAAAIRSIEKLETLVESYMVMLLILLCTYILTAVMSSTAVISSTLGMRLGGPSLVYFIVFVAMPLTSIFFMLFAHILQKGTFISVRKVYYRALPPAVGVAALLALVILTPEVRALVDSLGSSIFITVCLAAISLPPLISYRRMVGLNLQAEEEMPSFLRDVSETRKTGTSPEKSIVQSARIKRSTAFSKVLRQVVNQIEWGVSLRKIYRDLKERINSWPVLMNFLILIETVEVGGGSSDALEMLASYSEKMRDAEKNKRDMLRPYIILPFIWSVLMALTFTFTFFVITQIPTAYVSEASFMTLERQMDILSSAMIFHCWLSGFFIGKVTKGTFAAGFEYSVFLAVVSLASLLLSQNFMSTIVGVLM